MKRISILLITFIFIFSFSSVYAADEIKVLVNGKQVVADTPAVIVSGTTMLPFRSIFNSLGVGDDSIKWNVSSKSIEVNYKEKYIFLLVGSTGAIINDQFITLNVAPYIENGRTLVPVRFISESLGADVQWDGKTKTVKITK